MKLTCFLLLLLLGISLSAQKHILHKEIDKIIRLDTDIPYPIEKSFIVGLIKGDSTWIINFGPEHIDTLEKFEIGGISKVFTASLAVKLAEDKVITLAHSINSYLPERYQNKSLAKFTLADLLLHQIPFPKRPSNLALKEYDISNPYKYYTKLDLLNYYANFEPRKRNIWSGPQLNYSHINYALLEIILEDQMDMPLEDLFQFYLFQDLKLYNTSLNFPAEKIKVGYDRSNMIPEAWQYQSFAGSEGLVSCLLDLMSFTRQSMNRSAPYILKSQELREEAKVSRKIAMTYAWYTLNSSKTGRIFTHSGSTERHKAYIHFKVESKTGVVILCQSSQGVEELGMLILRLINNNWK